MFRKLIHHRPFFRKPPFEDPRELEERYPKEPILTDYWIKPYILEALKNYPRLNDSCVVEGLWTFANSILLKNYKAAKRVPPTFDDPEVTHKIAFLDKEDVELGSIKFWRKVDSTFGIDVKLGSGGISIVGDNDNPTMSLVNTPVNGAPKEIVNVEYLNQAFSTFTSGLNDLTNRVESLEDLYNNHVKPLVTDSNDNYRGVHTTIHADASDANLPTCGAVYQYGKGISDALNGRIDGLANGLSDLNNALNGLSSRIGSIANDVANLQNTVNNLGSGSGGDSGGGSGGGSNDSYIFAYPSGTVEGGDMPTPEVINAWNIVTGNHIASAVEVSVYSTANHPDIVTYTIDQNSNLDSNSFIAAYYENEAVYNPTNLSSSDSYRCIVAPEVVQGTVNNTGNTRPTVRVKAGVFQRIASAGGGSGSNSGDATWAAVSQSWSQFRAEMASSGSYKSLSQSNTSLLGNISGTGTNYNTPQFTVDVAANGQFGDGNCVDIGETFTCTNTSTNVSKSYIPLRLVVTYDGTRHSDGGSEPGGTYWQSVSAKVWYKEANYTLTSQDISDINAAADAFAASRSLGYDSGALS